MPHPVRPAVAALALLLAAPAVAQPPAADGEVGTLVCELSGDCAAPEAATTPRGARTSSTRGFTFKRTAPSPTGTPGTEAAAPATARRVGGAANLRLDFASGSSTLTPPARARLAKLATALGNPRLAERRLRIEGHTDASGNATANRDLSQRRAQSAADFLVAQGIARTRLDVVGYGAARPLPGLDATAAENRRVMAVVLD